MYKQLAEHLTHMIGGGAGLAFVGGAARGRGGSMMALLTLFLVALMFLLLRAWVVSIAYNYVVPQFAPQFYKQQINLTEAVGIVILFQSLIG